MRRLLPVLLLALCLAAGCGSRAPEPEPTLTAEPTPAPTAEPEPTPTPPPEPEPIALTLDAVEFEVLDNAGLRGHEPQGPDEEALHTAAEGARAALERYLNAQFVTPDSRFGDAGVAGLVGPHAAAALTDDDRRGLGQLNLDVAQVAGEPATAQAIALIDGAEVLSVTLTHEAVMTMTFTDGRTEEARQHGTMVFRSVEGEWRAEILDIGLDAPEEDAA